MLPGDKDIDTFLDGSSDEPGPWDFADAAAKNLGYLVMSEEMIRYQPQTFPNGLGRLEFSRLAGDALEDPGVRIHRLRPQNHPSLPLPADTQGPWGGRQDALRAIKVLFGSCCSSRIWMSDCTGSPLADLGVTDVERW